MALIGFLQHTTGRAVRVAAGLALIGLGLALGGGWIALAVVGLVPLVAGAAGVCLIAPLAHQPLRAPHRAGA